jgi:hypothetical protein
MSNVFNRTLNMNGGRLVRAKFNGITVPIQPLVVPTLLNGWTVQGSSLPFGVWVDGEGNLCFQGLLTGGAAGSSILFDLPETGDLATNLVPGGNGYAWVPTVQWNVSAFPAGAAAAAVISVQGQVSAAVTVYDFAGGGGQVLLLDSLKVPLYYTADPLG